MNQLEEMQTFIRIVEAGSITKAAEQMNTAKSAVSRRLSEPWKIVWALAC